MITEYLYYFFGMYITTYLHTLTPILYRCLTYICENISALCIYITITSPYLRDRDVTMPLLSPLVLWSRLSTTQSWRVLVALVVPCNGHTVCDHWFFLGVESESLVVSLFAWLCFGALYGIRSDRCFGMRSPSV